MGGENVVREIDGEFAQNMPSLSCHYFVNLHFNYLFQIQVDYWRVYL